MNDCQGALVQVDGGAPRVALLGQIRGEPREEVAEEGPGKVDDAFAREGADLAKSHRLVAEGEVEPLLMLDCPLGFVVRLISQDGQQGVVRMKLGFETIPPNPQSLERLSVRDVVGEDHQHHTANGRPKLVSILRPTD
eukprot:GAFH01003334.1.p2 GENE.GAFH01003334.1~~GAFH01003334.1.p2  ORF type:complete len:138 (-),score=19.86 GAFH01003334.1:270-683(-)